MTKEKENEIQEDEEEDTLASFFLYRAPFLVRTVQLTRHDDDDICIYINKPTKTKETISITN